MKTGDDDLIPGPEAPLPENAPVPVSISPEARAKAAELSAMLARETAERTGLAHEAGAQEPVAWQRRNSTSGWIDCRLEDVERYRALGQEIRALGVIEAPAPAPQPGGDLVAAFEGRWSGYRHSNRQPADYGTKKTIAWNFFDMGFSLGSCTTVQLAVAAPLEPSPTQWNAGAEAPAAWPDAGRAALSEKES